MKVLILLFFIFSFPIALFLATILYGGFSNTLFKEQLLHTHVYQQIGNLVSNIQTDNAMDTSTLQLEMIAKKRFTPAYIQTKAEETIDASSNWITNTSSTPPVISFREVKEDILSENPDLLISLEQMAKDLKTQTSASDPSTDEETLQVNQALSMMQSLVSSNFSIRLDKYLASAKSTYDFLKITLPILLTLLIGSLLLMGFLSHSWPSRLKWIGTTLMLSGIWGFGVIAFSALIATALFQLTQSNTNQLMNIFSPIILAFITHFMKTYTNYQGIASIILLLVASGCFILASRTNATVPPIQKAKVIKKK